MQSHITSIIPGGSGYARREHDIGSTTERGEALHHMRSMKNTKCLADTISAHFQETQTGILGTFKILFALQYSCYMIIISNQHVLCGYSYCTMELLVNTTLHQTNVYMIQKFILGKKNAFLPLFLNHLAFFPRTSQSYNVHFNLLSEN